MSHEYTAYRREETGVRVSCLSVAHCDPDINKCSFESTRRSDLVHSSLDIRKRPNPFRTMARVAPAGAPASVPSLVQPLAAEIKLQSYVGARAATKHKTNVRARSLLRR